jgi:protein SCO1/2
LDLRCHDEQGKSVQLGDYFGTKPVILILGYYGCPMLCNLVLNGTIECLQHLKSDVGKEFDIINVSIDPRETPALAAAKKRTYLKRYGRPRAGDGWHFLTGDPAAIGKLTDEVGFHYAYDASIQQYAHPSGLIVLTPEGKVSRYFFGVNYSAKELNAALKEAAGNKIGSRIEQLFLLCFHYSPLTGKYGDLIMAVVRISGAVTIVALGLVLVGAARRRRRALSSEAPK